MSKAPEETAFETIAKTVGAIVINWGMAERSLDYTVAILWHYFGGKSKAKRIPKMLETKVSFVKTCIEETPSLFAFSKEAEELLSEYTRLGMLRNDIVHSAVQSTEGVQDRILLSKLDIRDGLHHSRDVEITPASFPVVFRDLLNLSGRGLAFASDLLALSEEREAEA